MTLVCLSYNWKSKSLNPIIGYRVKMTLHVNPTCGQMAWPCPDDSKMVWHLVFGLMSLILYPKNVSDTKKVTAFTDWQTMPKTIVFISMFTIWFSSFYLGRSGIQVHTFGLINSMLEAEKWRWIVFYLIDTFIYANRMWF